MENPETFTIFTGHFFQDADLLGDNLEDLVTWAGSALTVEQRREVKRFIDGLIEAGDVAQAQRIWWKSRAEISFRDRHIIEALRRVSAQLGSMPAPAPSAYEAEVTIDSRARRHEPQETAMGAIAADVHAA